MRAKILRSNKRDFDCMILESKELVVATALAKQIKGREKHLVVGDEVILEKGQDGDKYTISEAIPRRNEIFRRNVRENLKKVIASNVDLIVIMTSVGLPEYKQGLVDRYLARATQWDIPVVVIFNKMDKYNDDPDVKFEADRVAAITVGQFEISCSDPNYQKRFLTQGLEELKHLLHHKCAIFLGQSGVGKSKLISLLTDGKVELLSQELAKVGKGAHTTTWAEMIDAGDFWLIDSPGVRSFALNDIPSDDMNDLFPDLIPYIQRCKFTNCQHMPNSKGCAFLQLSPDNYQDSLILSRLHSFIKIREEIESLPDWEKA